MKESSEVTACVLDHGLYLPLAIELTRHYKRVLYQNLASVEAFPTLNKCIIGDGIDGLEIIQLPKDHWDYKPEIDLYIFPDLYHGGEQLELESQGKAVWGSRHGDRMEVYRGKFLDYLAKTELEVAPHEVIVGLDRLRQYLKSEEDVYIKISKFRGTMETFHWRDWDHDNGWLDRRAVQDGPAKNLITYYVFQSIKTEIEIGLDTYSIDGAFPDTMLVGYEHKDKGYFGAVSADTDIPSELKAVNDAFVTDLVSNRYRNFISSEIRRVSKDEFYFIEPTRRAPCPGYGSQLKLYGNLGEILWRGAQGEMVQPEPTAQYSTECVITCKGGKNDWSIVRFPPELAAWVMCGGSCEVEGKTCWPPDESHEEEVGWLVNTANTPKAAVQGLLDKARLLPDGVHAATDSMVDLLKEIDAGQSQGIKFTDKPVPEPEIALDLEPS